jgi:hypothetical protein
MLPVIDLDLALANPTNEDVWGPLIDTMRDACENFGKQRRWSLMHKDFSM